MQVLSEATKLPISAGDCARVMLDGLPAVMWFIRRHMRRHRAQGLSVPQFRMLVLLERYPTASLSLAAEHLGCSLPSASRMIQGLVTKGLAVRSTCKDDRRQVCLVLTPRGQQTLRRARQATNDCLEERIAGLSEDQQHTIAQAMMLLKDLFGPQAEL